MAQRFRGIPDQVMAAARAEYQVVLTGVDELWPIRHAGTVVGFYAPRGCKLGRRVGPLFVLPEHRRKGLALSVYAAIKGPLVACVRDDNPASTALHERAGFTRWKRYAAGWWWRRT